MLKRELLGEAKKLVPFLNETISRWKILNYPFFIPIEEDSYSSSLRRLFGDNFEYRITVPTQNPDDVVPDFDENYSSEVNAADSYQNTANKIFSLSRTNQATSPTSLMQQSNLNSKLNTLLQKLKNEDRMDTYYQILQHYNLRDVF